MKIKWMREGLGLGLVLLLAVSLRLPALDRVPPGLWFDEALDGQDAAAVWAPGGHFRLVYPDVFPREAIYTSLLAVAIKLGGPEVLSLRLVSVVIGVLTVALLYGMLRGEWGPGPALCAAGVLATLRWHVIFSRLVFRTIILGPWLIGITWAALSLRRRPHPGKAIALGMLLGGGFYTYLTWYFMAPWLLVLSGWLVWHARAGRVPWRHLGLCAAAGVITFAPLGLHYLHRPQDLFARPQEVSVFKDGTGPALQAITKNALDAALMFHLRGDHVPKHNIPLEPDDRGGHYGRPAVDIPQRIGLVMGLLASFLLLATRGIGGWAPPRALACLLPLWIGSALLATIFTVTDSPNFLRTLCATPAVAALSGLGLWTGMTLLEGNPEHPRFSSRLRGAVLAALIVVSGGLTARAVYREWPERMDVWQNYNGDIFAMAELARRLPENTELYVPQYLYEHRTFQFMLLGNAARARVHPYADFDWLGNQRDVTPATRWVITTAQNQAHTVIEQLLPHARMVHPFRAPAGNTYALTFAFGPGDLPSPDAVRQLQNSWRGDLRF